MKSIEDPSPPHQTYTATDIWKFRPLDLKVDPHVEDRRFIHGPKHRKENQLLSLEHPCDDNLSTQSFRKDSPV